MMVLALDQSVRRTGFAVLEAAPNGWRGGTVVHSGWFGSRAGSQRAAVDTFKREVTGLILDYHPEVLAWERPAVFRSMRSSAVLARLDEALVALADRHELTAMSAAAATWRSKVLGKGSARLASRDAKARAVAYCGWLGLKVLNPDQAEAVCIGLWAAAELQTGAAA